VLECKVYSIGARRHGQEGALAPSPGNVKNYFLLQTLSKTSVDEVFMHHLE